MALISVIIPCYNCGNFVSRAINSVLKQSFGNWELLLVDNNSTDNTLSILESYVQKHPGKIKIYKEDKQGAPAARNKGLKKANGKWIQFLDADDEILPAKLEGQYALATKKRASIVASPYTLLEFHSKATRIRTLYSEDFWIALVKSQMGITSANLWNKELLIAAGGWDEELIASQEYDLMFRMLQLSPIVGFDNRNLTIIHIEQGESVSRGGNDLKGQMIMESKIVLRFKIKDYLFKNNLLTNDRLYFIDKFIYQTLIKNYRYWPAFIVNKLKQTNLEVTLLEKVKGIYFRRKMDLRSILVKKDP
jgi:glycosyltransferase involved in cell wall biosynthesis